MFIRIENLKGVAITLNTDNITNMYLWDDQKFGRVCLHDSTFEVTPETYNRIEQALKVVDLTQPANIVEREWRVFDTLEITHRTHEDDFQIGERVEIVDIDTNDSAPYRCSNGKRLWWVAKSEARLITD